MDAIRRSERIVKVANDLATSTAMSREEIYQRLMRSIFTIEKYDLLLDTVKLAYRKHHLDDQSVGWEELSDKLQITLCEIMGDSAFQVWLDQQKEQS